MKESTHAWQFLVENLLLTNLEKMNIQSPDFKSEKKRYYQLTVFFKLTNAFLYFFLWKQTGTTILSSIGWQALQLSYKDGLKIWRRLTGLGIFPILHDWRNIAPSSKVSLFDKHIDDIIYIMREEYCKTSWWSSNGTGRAGWVDF